MANNDEIEVIDNVESNEPANMSDVQILSEKAYRVIYLRLIGFSIEEVAKDLKMGTATLMRDYARELSFKNESFVAEAMQRLQQFLRSPKPEHRMKALEVVLKNSKRSLAELSEDEIAVVEEYRRFKVEKSQEQNS